MPISVSESNVKHECSVDNAWTESTYGQALLTPDSARQDPRLPSCLTVEQRAAFA